MTGFGRTWTPLRTKSSWTRWFPAGARLGKFGRPRDFGFPVPRDDDRLMTTTGVSDGSEWPEVDVVVPTRNRPQHAVECAQAILATQGFRALIMVDQSSGSETRLALEAISDSRLRYVHSELRGATSGRNVGIESSHADVIAFTDDDCRVAPNWILCIAAIFRKDPQTAVVCGRVKV